MKMNKLLAEKHFGHLQDNWMDDERRNYEECYEVKDANNIPTSKLKESNYKDLRVIQEFFEEYHYA